MPIQERKRNTDEGKKSATVGYLSTETGYLTQSLHLFYSKKKYKKAGKKRKKRKRTHQRVLPPMEANYIYNT